ncbi:unnamed protein product [Rhizophagus irregularis]|nr:unnamed protein product [Rhizophagus irregularis]
MLENDFDYIGWIEKAVEDNYIPNFDHTKFINKEEIGSRIIKANLSETDTILVVKSGGLKEIVNELRIQKEVDFHANILRFCGISKPDNRYSLVLEYADDGTLYSYLKKDFTKLEWDDKYRLALQLASAVECIHNKGIIHCDLHAHNVLLHKGVIKVADFGLSKKAIEASNYSAKEVYGLMPYVDPRHLAFAFDITCTIQLSIMDFKSDIYSIGVLFWLLSSGRRPFCDESIQYDNRLAMNIISGRREKFIEGTPIKYSNLYTACWASDPNERPSIQQVVSDLKSIENNEAIYSTKCTTKNEIKKEPPNKDIDYVMDNDHSDLFIDDDFPNSKIDDDVDLNTNDFIQNNLVLNLTDLTDNVERIIDQLIDHLMRMHDEMGYSFMETKQAIDQNIKNINRPLLDKIFDRLIKNQTSSRYIFFHGFLYFNEIIVKRDNSKAFELFSKALKDNCPIVQVYLGKMCKDPKDSFYWYQKSAENGNKLAQFYLGMWTSSLFW